MISEKLRGNFDRTIGLMLAVSSLLLFLSINLALSTLSANTNSVIQLLIGVLVLSMSFGIKMILRHLHDQIDTYYKAQTQLKNIGTFGHITIGVAGLMITFTWLLYFFLNTQSIGLLKTSYWVWIGGNWAFGYWIFSISRSLRFLNLISNSVKVIGYYFGIATFFVPFIGAFIFGTDELAHLLFWAYAATFTLSIGWLIGLYRCLTK